jgi:hypothetical protein
MRRSGITIAPMYTSSYPNEVLPVLKYFSNLVVAPGGYSFYQPNQTMFTLELKRSFAERLDVFYLHQLLLSELKL